jgi:hypothetical protein
MFCPRLVDNTNISFTEAQTSHLNNFLRYDLHCKQKHWVTALTLEDATAISYVPTDEQEFVRQQV